MFKICLSCLVFLAFSFSFAGEITPTNEYVGRETCKVCHKGENEKWQGSHHDQAMQQATEKSVLGNFDQVRFNHFDTESFFFKKDGLFMVRTDGPDGKLKDYPIKYTLGFYPLQQYLIEFPGGRLQALDIAWDSRPKEKGGQRWMHLHPDEKITHDDVLHWTGPNLNWNYMCADCHSTHLQKNFDPEKNVYHTIWSELDVSCEACHGPGSGHVNWAKNEPSKRNSIPDMGLKVLFRDRKNVKWTMDQKSGRPVRSQKNNKHSEIEVCARCHSRRSQIAEDDKSRPLMDAYIPALLTEGLYHADGQILDEVYVYGSFLQSRMFQAGVTCSDCHDPHSNALKKPGDRICFQCHLHDRYATPKHHFHVQDSSGANCVECHMPSTTYMQVDARHDHSFRVPRPDLSVNLLTPNACNHCHTEQSAQWSADLIRLWYGKNATGFQTFAETFQSARMQKSDARNLLQTIAEQTQPAIVTATVLQELQAFPDRKTFSLIEANLKSSDPLQRRSALIALRHYDLRAQAMLAFPLLDDPVRAVRVEAIGLLVQIPQGNLSKENRALFERAIEEYIQAQRFNAERPESQVNLGGFYSALRRNDKAESAYKKAIRLQPMFVPAYVNLAQLYSTQGIEGKAEAMIRQGMAKIPDNPDLAEVMGLSLIRQQQKAKALPWLAEASLLDPNNIRYAYVHAVALHSLGNSVQAIKQLESVQQRFPGNTDILYALVTFNRDAGNTTQALNYLKKLRYLAPENPQLNQLEQELRSER